MALVYSSTTYGITVRKLRPKVIPGRPNLKCDSSVKVGFALDRDSTSSLSPARSSCPTLTTLGMRS